MCLPSHPHGDSIYVLDVGTETNTQCVPRLAQPVLAVTSLAYVAGPDRSVERTRRGTAVVSKVLPEAPSSNIAFTHSLFDRRGGPEGTKPGPAVSGGGGPLVESLQGVAEAVPLGPEV